MNIWSRCCKWFSANVPAQWRNRLWQDVPLLAVDLELTSLNANTCGIVSAGWVAGQGGDIQLASASHRVVNTPSPLKQSPVIHGLTDRQVAEGAPLEEVLQSLLPYARTHMWVMHHSTLDWGALNRAFERCNIAIPGVVVLDTLDLMVYYLKKRYQMVPHDAVSLAGCRQQLGLPDAPAHNALEDAIATLQVWYALFEQLNGRNFMQVDDFLHTRAIKYKKIGRK
ncbi:3'-5' exonuclease [Alteromonas sp. ASW11-19]|uniref:3'-5' exonuclease n=1 Tax=Alteromonas salexigens TaxID=2982530 RepID=A0ABT2VK86_9ALTE|nr:3'-5' exonuclease [Alteromonas salexigens]MCU7553687.1 3'-5' exonuclease [Alteromonas salexigens]